MQTYHITGTDLAVSRIGFGCMNLGGAWGDDVLSDSDIQHARQAVVAARDAGYHFFDHADIYRRGKSEIVFGRILQEHPGWRDNIIIQTKCGIRFADPHHPYRVKYFDFSADYITSSVERSLQRLQTDRIDILVLHRPDVLMEPEEVAGAFDHLFQSGKVRYFGISNSSAGQIDVLRRHLRQPLIIHQVQLNLLHHRLIDEDIMVNSQAGLPPTTGLLNYCRMHHMMVQAWSPLAQGEIFKSEGATINSRNAHVAALVRRLAVDKQVGPEAIMLAWLLRHPAGIQPIIGSTHPDRIRTCAHADSITLSREEWYALFVAARGEELP